MKKLLGLLAVAMVLSSPARAEEGSEFWFGDRLAWYQHPCGWDAFVKYGGSDTPQNRRNYYLTLQHPQMCSTLFP